MSSLPRQTHTTELQHPGPTASVKKKKKKIKLCCVVITEFLGSQIICNFCIYKNFEEITFNAAEKSSWPMTGFKMNPALTLVWKHSIHQDIIAHKVVLKWSGTRQAGTGTCSDRNKKRYEQLSHGGNGQDGQQRFKKGNRKMRARDNFYRELEGYLTNTFSTLPLSLSSSPAWTL